MRHWAPSLTALGGVAAMITFAAPSVAQPRFGAKGSFAVTGEELVGYHSEKRVWDNDQDEERKTQRGGLGLFVTTGGARVGAHYFLLPQFSVGGVIGYDLRTGKNTMEDGAGDYTTDLAKEHTFILAPRAGYALMFTDVVGFWFRAGPTMNHQVRRVAEWNDDDKNTDTVYLASADIFFVVAPVPHFGIFLGPQGDISFAGKHKEARLTAPDSNEVDEWSNPSRYSRLGASFGLVGFF